MSAGGERGAGKGGSLFPWLAGGFCVLLALVLGIRAYQFRNENDVGSFSKAEGARTAAATPVPLGPMPAALWRYLAEPAAAGAGERFESALVDAAYARTGTDPAVDLLPGLTARVAMAAVRADRPRPRLIHSPLR